MPVRELAVEQVADLGTDLPVGFDPGATQYCPVTSGSVSAFQTASRDDLTQTT